MDDDDRDREAIIAVIEAETLAFYSRDFDRWQDCWVQDEGARRLAMLGGGQIDYHEGRSVGANIVTRVMEQFPEPNPQGAQRIRRENFNVRVAGDMAWASFDQYCPDNGDAFDSIGLSHQIRILERHKGAWKIACVASGETSIGFYEFPVIRVARDAAILWMNTIARTSLADHPCLVVSGQRLMARFGDGNDRLRAALAEVDDLSPMDIRLSVSAPARVRRTVPVVMESASSEISSICWVSWQDGMLIVSFNDKASEARRLAVARSAFGLSEAQTRLAGLIVDGHDLSTAARALGVSTTTARTHLQRMFDKTGVRSQSALVRVLLSVEPPAP